MSDYIGSTAEIIDYAKKSDCSKFIICTEQGVEYKLKGDNPGKEFVFVNPAPCCKDMKLNTLENILKVLKEETNEVVVDIENSKRALVPLDRMLECAK